jgi:Protein of unknown function (DUF2971)
MYGALYKELNDPMEGVYGYGKSQITPDNIQSIRDEKTSYRILSLSETSKNLLMWSHYANAHKGIVIGVKIPENQSILCVDSISYEDDLNLPQSLPSDIAQYILLKKLKLWEYEREVRVLIKERSFINVEICEVILGCRIDGNDSTMIRDFANRFTPEATIISMAQADLEKGKLGNDV